MNTTFRRFKLLALRTMGGDALKDDVNGVLEDFDDVMHVCGLYD